VPIGNQYTQNVNGADVMFEDLKTSPAVVVSVKENPSIPLTLFAIGCFGAGMPLVVFRTGYRMGGVNIDGESPPQGGAYSGGSRDC
jgi:hypothetical protein